MKYWIIALISILVAGVASAETIISSDLVDSEVVGRFTTVRWEARIQAVNFNACFVDLKILDAEGNVVLTSGMQFPMWDRNGIESNSRILSASNDEVARWASMKTKLDCY